MRIKKSILSEIVGLKSLSRTQLKAIGGGKRDTCTAEQVNSCTFVQYYPEGTAMLDCGVISDDEGNEEWISCEAYLA